MSKLYVGNLPADATESNVRQLFLDQALSITGVLLKRGGYAFVDCADQSVADRSIDKLNGFSFLGTPLVVEPSVSPAATATNKKTLSNGTPSEGTTVSEATMNGGTFPPAHAADAAAAGPAPAPAPAPGPGPGPNTTGLQGGGERRPRPRMPFGGLSGQQAPLADFPLRMLVSSEMVGAIIGRQGNTIRQITQSTRARVDVHRKDNSGSLEKAITIYGNPENCDNACKKILEVMLQEADNTGKSDVPLKILAHNNLIGRIIGKGGNVIKRVMEETDTKITVSSVADVNSFNPERTISIRGALAAMAAAERLVVARLRQSYENDLQALAPQSLLYPGLHPMAMMSTLGLGFSRPGGALAGGPGAQGLYGAGPAHYPPLYPPLAAGGGGGGAAAAQALCETVYLYVPSQTVGALIGRKGSYIRNVIRFSGASVKISQEEHPSAGGAAERPGADGRGGADGPPARLPLLEPLLQRRVTVLGSPEAQWKAQFLIFDKMREEGYGAGIEDVRLPVEMAVPTSQVGRIIGKKGQNVRDMQRSTGTTIQLPQAVVGAAPPELTLVQMAGPFYSVQSAQRRIRALVAQASGRPARGATLAPPAAPHAAAGEPPYKPTPAAAAPGPAGALRL